MLTKFLLGARARAGDDRDEQAGVLQLLVALGNTHTASTVS